MRGTGQGLLVNPAIIWPVLRTLDLVKIMQRKIIGFQLDDIGDWTALLECGHRQHVRHDPPLTNRPWVLLPEGRQRFIGFELNCKLCDEEKGGIPNCV